MQIIVKWEYIYNNKLVSGFVLDPISVKTVSKNSLNDANSIIIETAYKNNIVLKFNTKESMENNYKDILRQVETQIGIKGGDTDGRKRDE